MDLKTYGREVEEELFSNLLPFVSKYCVDQKEGGFYGRVAYDGTADTEALKGLVQHARLLWTYSRVYQTYGTSSSLESAEYAYVFLQNHFYDKEFGGYFWTVAASGRSYESKKSLFAIPKSARRAARLLSERLPKNRWGPSLRERHIVPPRYANQKIICGQAFVIFALAEYYLATGERKSLDEAIALYALLQKHVHDVQYGGYYDVCSRAWDVIHGANIEQAEGPVSKTEGTQMPLLAAFTVLFRAWPDAELYESLEELIRLHLEEMVDGTGRHLGQMFDARWQIVNDKISFGHDIEISWLLVEAAEALGDPELLHEVKAFALRLAEITLAEGVDDAGAVLNNQEQFHYRISWAQAEGMVGFLNAYQLSGDQRFLEASINCWRFVKEYMIDIQDGSWFQLVSPDGQPLPGRKLGIWGGPFHKVRTCIEVKQRTDELLTAV